ncbi:phosphoribosyltransferase family protein [Sphingomonas adhaesiva]|uniref:phosphoribosyltransferase family protein n=1 Tax=Sphingomonas adhaesiva TaxID=28212 RepID=UPI002FF9E936
MPIFTAIPHADIVALIRTLAGALRADDWMPTHIIGIGRGGLIPAVYLSHATGWPMRSVDYSSQSEELAADAIARLAARTRAGERLLFVDDINDSGRTIGHLRAMMALEEAPSGAVRFATLIDNVRSHQRVDYAARTIDRDVTKDWFVFPWEAMAPDSAIAADAAEVPDRIT